MSMFILFLIRKYLASGILSFLHILAQLYSHFIILVDKTPKAQPIMPEATIKISSYKFVAELTYVVTFVSFVASYTV